MKLKPKQTIHVPEADQGCDYALVDVTIGGHKVQARPYDFVEADGRMVPTKVAVQCPGCGCGMFVDLPANTTDVAGHLRRTDLACDECKLGLKKELMPGDPFLNPWDRGLMTNAVLVGQALDRLSEVPAETAGERASGATKENA